jgi:hypothetical protein
MFREGVTATAANRFSFGDIVQLNAGVVTAILSPAANASNDGATGPDALGVVLANHRTLAVAGTAEDVPVLVFDDNMQFLLPLYHATAATTVYSSQQIGEYFQIRMQGGIPCADVTTKQSTVTGGVQLQLVDKLPIPAAEQYGHAWFKVIAAERTFR